MEGAVFFRNTSKWRISQQVNLFCHCHFSSMSHSWGLWPSSLASSCCVIWFLDTNKDMLQIVPKCWESLQCNHLGICCGNLWQLLGHKTKIFVRMSVIVTCTLLWLIHLLSHKARLITKLCLSSVMVEQSTVNNRGFSAQPLIYILGILNLSPSTLVSHSAKNRYV